MFEAAKAIYEKTLAEIREAGLFKVSDLVSQVLRRLASVQAL